MATMSCPSGGGVELFRVAVTDSAALRSAVDKRCSLTGCRDRSEWMILGESRVCLPQMCMAGLVSPMRIWDVPCVLVGVIWMEWVEESPMVRVSGVSPLQMRIGSVAGESGAAMKACQRIGFGWEFERASIWTTFLFPEIRSVLRVAVWLISFGGWMASSWSGSCGHC